MVWQDEAGELRRQRRQLVVVGGEQGAAAVDLVQMLDAGPGDRQPVEGRGAAADLVEDHQRAGAGLVEDGRRLDHLDHEGRTAARQIVGGADAAEQPVDDADPAVVRRHEAADLRHDRRSARSGAGRWTCRPCWGRSAARGRPSGARSQSLATKAGRLRRRRAPPRPPDGGRPRCRRPGCRRPWGGSSGARPRVRPGRSRRRAAPAIAAAARAIASAAAVTSFTRSSNSVSLERQRLVGGRGDPALQLAQLDRGEAHGAGQRLAVDEGLRRLAGHQLVGVGRRHLDVVAEHVVVADLQRRGTRCRIGIARLQAAISRRLSSRSVSAARRA